MYRILSSIKRAAHLARQPAFSLEPTPPLPRRHSQHLHHHLLTVEPPGWTCILRKGHSLDQVPFGQFFFHKPIWIFQKEPGAAFHAEDLIPTVEDVKTAICF